jgi:methylated-DNA-[protein]-cysteine S-methyltransferase
MAMCAALWTQGLRNGLPATLPVAEAEAGTARAAASGAANVATSRRKAARPALAYASFASPFGIVHLAASADGVRAVSLYETEAAFRARLAPASWDLADAGPVLAQAVRELTEYFAGTRRVFGVPVDLCGATEFDRRVLAAIVAIPYGETRTYGQLARELGNAGASRAVGHGCGRNPVPLLIACHRVVRADGSLAGFGAGGVDVKARLLAMERGAPMP